MTFAGIAFIAIGIALFGLYREIERGAAWIEDLVGPRRLLSLMVQSDTILRSAATFVMFGGLLFIMGSTLKGSTQW